ncbi:MAG TPA: phage holin family protein [Fimbriiglobus sp.]|jgi:hypothetical protein
MTGYDQEQRESDSQRMSALVGDILNDVGKLVGQQAALFRAEVREDFHRTTRAVKYIGFGLATAGVGGLFLAVAAVHGLAAVVPTLPIWGCWSVVGAALLLVGGTAAVAGRLLVKSFNPLPNKSLAALEENVSWIANPQN